MTPCGALIIAFGPGVLIWLTLAVQTVLGAIFIWQPWYEPMATASTFTAYWLLILACIVTGLVVSDEVMRRVA